MDGAGDLHLVPVPAVDEGLLLFYLRFMLNIQAYLKYIEYINQYLYFWMHTVAVAGLPHPLSAEQW